MYLYTFASASAADLRFFARAECLVGGFDEEQDEEDDCWDIWRMSEDGLVDEDVRETRNQMGPFGGLVEVSSAVIIVSNA